MLAQLEVRIEVQRKAMWAARKALEETQTGAACAASGTPRLDLPGLTADADPLLSAPDWLGALDRVRHEHAGPGARLRAVRRQAEAVRERSREPSPQSASPLRRR